LISLRPVPDQDLIGLLDALEAVPSADGHRIDLPGLLADRTQLPGHVSALLQAEDGGEQGQTL
jgi:hypothetical protein